MKIFLYIIGIVLPATVQTVNARQMQVPTDGITVTCPQIKQEGDSLSVSLQLNISELDLPSVRSLTITPVLTEGTKEKALPPILLNGANRHKVYRRNVSLGAETPEDYYTVIKVSRKGNSPIDYRESVAFEPWMATAQCYLVKDYCGCGGYSEQQTKEALAAVPVLTPVKPYEPQPMYCYAEPEKEIRKNRTELKDVYLNFPVNKTVIYPDYMNNRTELEKAQEMIENINSDRNLTILKITYRGYASPEGSVPSNCRLSEGRAAALKNYLIPRLKNNKLPMFSESGCEDWDGTIELLQKTDFEGRDLLLEAIRSCDRSDAAEMRLRTLQGGAPYASMLKEVYPKVRRVVCSVDYTVREFTVEEGRSLINERPGLLSLYEMYRVACSYPANSPEFLNTLRIAAKVYPHNETALLNEAVAALREGNDEKAAANLQKVTNRDSVVYLNAQGILLMHRGLKEEARACFETAARQDSEAARHNLSELEKTIK